MFSVVRRRNRAECSHAAAAAQLLPSLELPLAGSPGWDLSQAQLEEASPRVTKSE
jgi:hypothetical protein